MACIGNFAFASATQGWFTHRNVWYEVPFFLIVAFVMMQPGYSAQFLGLENKNIMYAVGLIIYALIYFNQVRRKKHDSRLAPA